MKVKDIMTAAFLFLLPLTVLSAQTDTVMLDQEDINLVMGG